CKSARPVRRDLARRDRRPAQRVGKGTQSAKLLEPGDQASARERRLACPGGTGNQQKGLASHRRGDQARTRALNLTSAAKKDGRVLHLERLEPAVRGTMRPTNLGLAISQPGAQVALEHDLEVV